MRLIHGLAVLFWMVNSGLMLHDSKFEDVSDWNQTTLDTHSENVSQFELINVYNDSDWIPIESTEHQCGCQFHPMSSGDQIIKTLSNLNELITELPIQNGSSENDDFKSSSSTTNEKVKLVSKIVISDGKDKNNGVSIDGAIPVGTTVANDKDIEFVPSTVVDVTVDPVDSGGETEDEAATKSILPTNESENSTVPTEAVDVTRLVISERPEETSTDVAIDDEDSIQTDSSNPGSTVVPVDSEKPTGDEDDSKTNEPEPESTSESLTTLAPEVGVSDSNSGKSTTKKPQVETSTIIIISPDFNESTKAGESDSTVTEATSNPVDEETSSDPETKTTEAQGEGANETVVTEESTQVTATTEDESESTPKESPKTTTARTSDAGITSTESATKDTEVNEQEPGQATAKDETVTNDSSTQSVESSTVNPTEGSTIGSTVGPTVDSTRDSTLSPTKDSTSILTVGSTEGSTASSTEVSTLRPTEVSINDKSTNGLIEVTSQESTQGSESITISTDSLPANTSDDSVSSTQASDENSPSTLFTATDLSSSLPTESSVDPSSVPTTVPSQSSSPSPTSTQSLEGSSSESTEPATTQVITESSPIPTNSGASTSELTDGPTIVSSTEKEEITTTSSMTTMSSSSQPTVITATTIAINTSESATASGVTMSPTTMITPTRITPNVTDIPKPPVKPTINQCIQFPALKSWRYDLLRRVAQVFYLIAKKRLDLPPGSPLRKSAIYFRAIRYLRRMHWSLIRTPLWGMYNARTQIIRMIKCEQSFNMFGSKVLVGIWKARLCCFNRLLIQCGTIAN